MIAVISVKVAEPQFEGQTKTKLGNSEVSGAVNQAVGEALTYYLEEHPKEAKQIADTLRKSVSVQITEIMNADSVNTVEEGNLPTSPSSPNVKKNMMLGALLGLVISMGFVVLIFILDDTVKTPDDVEKYLGLNVLTSIPIQEGSSTPKRAKQQRESRNAVKSRR